MTTLIEREVSKREGAASFDREVAETRTWFEGPRFLRDVMLALNSDPEAVDQVVGCAGSDLARGNMGRPPL